MNKADINRFKADILAQIEEKQATYNKLLKKATDESDEKRIVYYITKLGTLDDWRRYADGLNLKYFKKPVAKIQSFKIQN